MYQSRDLLQHDANLDEALTWADRAVSFNENFSTLRTKAGLLEKKGDGVTAAGLMERAMEFATEPPEQWQGRRRKRIRRRVTNQNSPR